jgi:hypothetical protein
MNVWMKTGVQNLLRNAQSGRYYARFTIAGKLKWVSLKTNKKSVATLRLNDERSKQDRMRMALGNVGTGTATMGELREIWEQEQLNNSELREATRKLRRQQVCGIVRTWPNFATLPPERLTRAAVEEWRNRVLANGTGFVNPFATTTKKRAKGIAPTTVNKMLDILRLMLDIAVQRGQLPVNPLASKGLKLKVTPKKAGPTRGRSVRADIRRDRKLEGEQRATLGRLLPAAQLYRDARIRGRRTLLEACGLRQGNHTRARHQDRGRAARGSHDAG